MLIYPGIARRVGHGVGLATSLKSRGVYMRRLGRVSGANLGSVEKGLIYGCTIIIGSRVN